MNSSFHTNLTDMTIEQYLRGCIGYDVSDEAIAVILENRHVESGCVSADVDARTKDLCRADLYMWCTSMPTVKGSVEDANGVWKHKEGGSEMSASDKRRLTIMANRIYKKYGEGVVSGSISFVSKGIRLWRK